MASERPSESQIAARADASRDASACGQTLFLDIFGRNWEAIGWLMLIAFLKENRIAQFGGLGGGIGSSPLPMDRSISEPSS